MEVKGGLTSEILMCTITRPFTLCGVCLTLKVHQVTAFDDGLTNGVGLWTFGVNGGRRLGLFRTTIDGGL